MDTSMPAVSTHSLRVSLSLQCSWKGESPTSFGTFELNGPTFRKRSLVALITKQY